MSKRYKRICIKCSTEWKCNGKYTSCYKNIKTNRCLCLDCWVKETNDEEFISSSSCLKTCFIYEKPEKLVSLLL